MARSLAVRLDNESRQHLAQAARLRRMSLSEYVRTVAIAQARKEVLRARDQVICLTPSEQLAFWTALNEAPRLTAAQRRLGTTMRGKDSGA
jgi:uncharacterized protein (DUF1778 family)